MKLNPFDIIYLKIEEVKKQEEEERIRTENLLSGNPLLNKQSEGDFNVNRRK